jgi:hypothetical protein
MVMSGFGVEFRTSKNQRLVSEGQLGAAGRHHQPSSIAPFLATTAAEVQS